MLRRVDAVRESGCDDVRVFAPSPHEIANAREVIEQRSPRVRYAMRAALPEERGERGEPLYFGAISATMRSA